MKRTIVTAQFSTNYARKSFRGREHYVVPVVMLMETVVNGAFVPASALVPETWNGVPVTISHPVNKRGESISANSPETLEKWQIGTVFNAKVEDGKLKGEAWIDVAVANKLAPGLIAQLKAKGKMDVSTGYFTVAKAETGEYKGVAYTEVHNDLKPDHFAILPDEEGACNWETGCGVRANSAKGKNMAKKTNLGKVFAALFSNKQRANETGDEDEDEPKTNEEIVSELIESDETPFTEEDRATLEELPAEVLATVRDELIGEDEEETGDMSENRRKNNAKGCGCGSAPKSNAKSAGGLLTMTPDQLGAMIANAAKEAVRAEIGDGERRELIAKITANKSLGLTASECQGMGLKALRKLAETEPSGKAKAANPVTNYAGRGFARQPDGGTPNTAKYPGMATHGKAPVKNEEKGE